MRSIFAKILLWFSGMAVLAVVSFVAISLIVAPRRLGNPFAGTRALQLDGAQSAFDTGGRPALATYLQRLRTLFGGQYYFTDAVGHDLVTGEDRSRLLADARPPGVWRGPRRDLSFLTASADGRYRLVVVAPLPPDWVTPAPYYAWIPIAIGLLCYILALHLASPACTLRDLVDRFGRGDLAIRSNSIRKDEFGDLARAFDRMAERIERLVADQRRLLQDVSHELRSPLARLSYAVQLAQVDATREEALVHITKDIGRLSTLATELLGATRTGVERTLQLEDVALGDVLSAIVGDCVRDMEAQSRSVVLEVPPELVVRAEPELLRRAAENVLRNALRYAPPGTAIDVRAERVPGAARITVRDRGPGVPDGQLDEIFRPFYRVDSDRNRTTGGTGLGLAIAHRTVTLHCGHISARNAHPGLEVVIDLPL